MNNIFKKIHIHADIPHTGLVNNLHSLVVESRSIVVAIRLVEDGEGHLVLLRLNVVVDTKDIEEVHLITRVESRVEVSLSELCMIKYYKKTYVLMIDGEIVHVVQRTHAVGNIVHSNTVILQVHNHTNRLGHRELLYSLYFDSCQQYD